MMMIQRVALFVYIFLMNLSSLYRKGEAQCRAASHSRCSLQHLISTPPCGGVRPPVADPEPA